MSFRGGLDLEGRIVIKVQLGDDIRKMLIHNDDITYDELVLMMQRVYKGTIQQDDELTIKYRDEDGDEITIFDSSDVSFAIQTCNRQLKLVLYVNGLERKFDNAEVATIKKGLQDVRDMVNGLLDEINAKTRSNPRLEASQDDDAVEDEAEPTSYAAPTSTSQLIKPYDNKEFDPLDTSSTLTQHADSGQGDKGTTGSQYAGSQYGGDAISKSFDQMSMSDRQSVNQSPTPASLQSSFGTAFNPQQQQQPSAATGQTTQQMPPANAATQYPSNMYSQQQQTPAQYANPMATQAGYQGVTGTTQQGYQGYNQQPSPAAPTSQYSQQQNGMPPVSTQAAQSTTPQQSQQPASQYTYNPQSWQSQNPAQNTATSQPQGMIPSSQTPAPSAQYAAAPGAAPGGYTGMPGTPTQQQMPQQGMYGQPGTAPGMNPYGAMPSPGNPYSKPGQIRGAYPRATGSYPQIPQPGAQQPGGFRPPGPQ